METSVQEIFCGSRNPADAFGSGGGGAHWYLSIWDTGAQPVL